MPELPGHEFRPQMHQIPEYADADALAAAMRDKSRLRPGEAQFARTGPGKRIPEKFTVENASLIVAIEMGKQHDNGKVEYYTTFLSDLGPRLSVECLQGIIQQIHDICARGTASTN